LENIYLWIYKNIPESEIPNVMCLCIVWCMAHAQISGRSVSMATNCRLDRKQSHDLSRDTFMQQEMQKKGKET
jgi:tartrate dehydratase alpha subunit/fumarate hydratase class I-like protein